MVSTSLLAGSIFLTHSLSAAIFVGVTALTVLFVFVSPKTFQTTRKTGLYWLLAIILGITSVSPFLAEALPAYLHDNSSAPGVQGVSDINSAILSTRILSLTLVLPLFLILLVYVLFSKRYNGRFINLPTLLLCSWLFVPLFLTQGYLFGFIIDYNRFLYFIILPVLIFIGLLISHGSDFLAKVIDNYRVLTAQTQKTVAAANKKIVWLKNHLNYKVIYSCFILFFLLFCFLFIPIFTTPSQNVGESIQSYYQFMDNPGWNAMQWKNQHATQIGVCSRCPLWLVAWRMFAQRVTLSAVDPQYLIMPESCLMQKTLPISLTPTTSWITLWFKFEKTVANCAAQP